MKKKSRDSGAAAMLVFLISMVISAFVLSRLAVNQRETNIRNAGYVAAGEANKIKYAIDSRVLSTEILEMILVDEGGSIRDFDKIAHKLCENDSAIRSIQLAPEGVVRYIYPLKGNEKGFVDLFADPNRKAEAEYARDSGKTTLAGPIELYQGGTGIVARRPVSIADTTGEQRFWGFSIVVLNVPEIFDKAELWDLTGQNYAYKLWRVNPDTKETQIILENESGDLVDPVDKAIEVPNGTWYLSIAPVGGWMGRGYIETRAAVAVAISALAALVCYGVMMIDRQRNILSVLANTDPLTGLYNERFLAEKLKELSEAQTPFGLFYLDLDKFKQVNDQYGHEVGDKLLIETGARLKSCIGNEDFAFRIGGDEFSVIIKGTRTDEYYRELKERIRIETGAPFYADGCLLYPRISSGYAMYPEEDDDTEELIKQADMRMYQDKRGGI